MYGGLGTHVLALTQEQARRGHQVTVITQAVPGDRFKLPGRRCLGDSCGELLRGRAVHSSELRLLGSWFCFGESTGLRSYGNCTGSDPCTRLGDRGST